jgi:hypothetical protein
MKMEKKREKENIKGRLNGTRRRKLSSQLNSRVFAVSMMKFNFLSTSALVQQLTMEKEVWSEREESGMIRKLNWKIPFLGIRSGFLLRGLKF